MTSAMLAALVAAAVAAPAPAPPSALVAPAGGPASAPASPPTVACCLIANGTVVVIEIEDDLSSRHRRPGDAFSIRLAEPVAVGGKVVLPEGLRGVGEVVDGAPSGFGGKPGKLVLAVRYLRADGVHVPLHGLKLSGTGKDQTGTALVVSIAVGLPGIFVHGGEIDIPAGTLARAKIGADMTLPPADQASAALQPSLATTDQGPSK